MLEKDGNIFDYLKLLSKTIVDMLTTDAHITWSWRDPLPSLLLLQDLLPSKLRWFKPHLKNRE